MAGKKRVRTAKDRPTTLEYGESPLPQSPQEAQMSSTKADDPKKANGATDQSSEARKVKKTRSSWSRGAQIWLLEQMVKQVEPYSADALAQRMAEAGHHANAYGDHFTAKQIAAKARSLARQANGRLSVPQKRVRAGGINAAINRILAQESQEQRPTF